LEEAAAWGDRVLKEEWIARVTMRRAMIGAMRAVTALHGGDSEGALRAIRKVFAVVPPPVWGVVAGLPLSVSIRAATDLGDFQAARRCLALPVAPAMLDTPFALPYFEALGRHHPAVGR